jgi:pyruvate dehydrogenase E2 component (dihydrolipoamide acetyltransferase)
VEEKGRRMGEKGEILFVFETEKITLEVEAQQPGFLINILVQVDDRVPVGQVVAYLAEKEGEKAEVALERPDTLRGEKKEVPLEVGLLPSDHIEATPLARKMAKEHGLELRKGMGSGPGGRIRGKDVERAIQSKTCESVSVQRVEDGRLVKFTEMRRIIAQKMLASKIETAQTYMVTTVNQPESAILAVGAIIDKPVVIDKQIVIRPMMKITLSYDHRIIDGAKAAPALYSYVT